MQDFLVQSSQAYYEYLVASNKGVQDMKLTSFDTKDNIFIFHFTQKIFSLDCIVFETEEFALSLDDERILEKRYYEELKRLEIELDGRLSVFFQEALNNQKLKIYSDLKFLVLNLKNFFAENAVIFPTHKNNIQIQDNPKLSIEQQKALKGLLNANVSYVWGPPGCGKTQFVLFEALYYYLQQNKKVCVLAPTNNALEQILQTLIEKMDFLGLERSKILRLGTPTANFIQHYKEVCDPYIIKQKKQEDLFTQITEPKERYNQALVFAMTLDGFIKRYSNLQIHFSHIFLDECAFTPLIKALAICVDNIPITLLGDHKQLTPICEMEEKEMVGSYESIKLWNFSSLFLEDFFFHTNILQKNRIDNPTFQKIQTFALNQTYRYGDNLAQILNQSIYQMPNGLLGIEEHTQLYFIDAKRQAEDTPHTSAQEAKEIHRLLGDLKEKDFAIITPFKRQRELIISFGDVPSHLVMTIHSSQGQEFDVIVFSPVILHYHLTDSRKIEALFALNVAISRLKKTLILVCDYEFWIREKNQFLCKILEQAKPYPKRIA